jgi:hypothetical protein
MPICGERRKILVTVLARLALSVVFFLVVTPAGFVYRAIGRSRMPLTFDPTAGTYWVSRSRRSSMNMRSGF